MAYDNIGEIELANKYIKLTTQRAENVNQDDFSLIINYNNRAALARIEEDVLKFSDNVIHINMFGQNSSMNVVQATNIALYEITKQFM